MDGDLTLHAVPRPVPLELELNGFQPTTPFGDSRVGFSARAEINRSDFGITFNVPLDGGSIMVGDNVRITLEVAAILQQPTT